MPSKPYGMEAAMTESAKQPLLLGENAMNWLPMIVLSLLLGLSAESCRSRTSPTSEVGSNNPTQGGTGGVAVEPKGEGDDDATGSEDGSSEEEETDSPSGPAPEDLETAKKLNNELTEKLKQLESQKKSVEDELKKVKDSSVPRIDPKPGEKGPSGNNFCPAAGYYGDIIVCGNYFCAKADAAFAVDCEAYPGLKPAPLESGFPPCPGYLYGTAVACGTKFCGYSDPGLTKKCQID